MKDTTIWKKTAQQDTRAAHVVVFFYQIKEGKKSIVVVIYHVVTWELQEKGAVHLQI